MVVLPACWPYCWPCRRDYRRWTSVRCPGAAGTLTSPAFMPQWTATTHRWPRCSRALSSGRGDATLPMGDERFRAGRSVTALALGEGRADAFDRRGRLCRDAQGRLTSRSRFEVGVGLLESHTTNSTPVTSDWKR